MNSNKSLYAIALAQTLFATIGFLNTAIGQDDSIIIALPEIHDRITSRSYYQDPVGSGRGNSLQDAIQPNVPDLQPPSSEIVDQERASQLKEQQELDDKSLADALDPTIPELFEQGRWPRKGIAAISLDISEKSEFAPQDIATKLVNSQAGRWNSFAPTAKVFAWAAPNIRYQPLYFEDVPLERYGQTKGPYRQTARSVMSFVTSTVLLPYHMYYDHPASCDYPLGFCRPGGNVPRTFQRQYFGHSDW